MLRVERALRTRHADACGRLRRVEQAVLIAGSQLAVALELIVRQRDLVRAACDVQRATPGIARVDPLVGDDAAHLVDRRVHRQL